MKAKEIFDQYPNQYTEKDVKAAREWLTKESKNTSNGVFASFANGQLSREQLRGPCHGSIGSVAPHGPLIASLTKNRTNPGYNHATKQVTLTHPEIAERWFTWLLYDTYWSPFYVETTVDQAMNSGLLVPSTLPANLMQGCNIITRHNHEHPLSILAWDALINAGMDPDVAYMLVFCLGLTLLSFENRLPINFVPLGHNAMGFLSPSVVRNYLDQNYNNLLKPMYNRPNISYGLSSIIPLNKNEQPTPWYGIYSQAAVPEHLIKFVKFLNSLGKKETFKVTSPFAKRETTLGLIAGMERPSAKVILENAKEVQKWLLKEYINE